VCVDEEDNVGFQFGSGAVDPTLQVLSVSYANQRSTWLIQLADVGVKWTSPMRAACQPGLIFGAVRSSPVDRYSMTAQA
jgi:hypothetical protein